MEEDFFLSQYCQILESKVRENMLENYIELYNSFEIRYDKSIKLSEYIKYFAPNLVSDTTKAKEELSLFIKYNYPGVSIEEDGSSISYNITPATKENIVRLLF